RNLPGVPLAVFSFFLAEVNSDLTVKKESSLPWVLPCLLFIIFLKPLLILETYATSTNTIQYISLLFPHTHSFLASLSMALFGPIPLMVPQ
uniref:Uncharacterized protein n=1 Tax=Neogobius melanostomus TaxID=47308 RepID=A0A8C6TEH0_9GOBI